MSNSLYDLSAEMQNLMDAEEVDETAIAVVFQDIANKAENVCKFLKVLDGDIDTFKAEEIRISERRKAMENKRDAVKRYVLENMITLGIPRLAAGTFTLRLQNNSQPALIRDNVEETPDDYYDIIPETKELAIDRIKNDLLDGKEVPGWSVKRGQHLRVR